MQVALVATSCLALHLLHTQSLIASLQRYIDTTSVAVLHLHTWVTTRSVITSTADLMVTTASSLTMADLREHTQVVLTLVVVQQTATDNLNIGL